MVPNYSGPQSAATSSVVIAMMMGIMYSINQVGSGQMSIEIVDSATQRHIGDIGPETYDSTSEERQEYEILRSEICIVRFATP